MAALTHTNARACAEAVVTPLSSNGGVTIDDRLTSELITTINRETDPLLARDGYLEMVNVHNAWHILNDSARK